MLNHRSALALAAMAAVTLSACSTNNTTTNTVSTSAVTATFMNSQGKAVVGATVAVTPDVSAVVPACPVTDASGHWSCNLPAGVYTLTVSGTGVTRTVFANVATVITGQPLDLGTKVVPYSPIVLSLSTAAPLDAGFNTTVAVNATVTGASGTPSYGWTLSRVAPAAWTKGTAYLQHYWVQNGNNVYECETSGTSATSGTGPSGTTPGANITDGTVVWNYIGATQPAPAISTGTATGTFTTESFDVLSAPANLIVRNQDLPNRLGLVGITVGDGQNMGYKATLTVTDTAGYTQNASLTVYPANFTHGTTNNPIGAMVVLTDGDPATGSGVPFAAYSWTFVSKPSTSHATIHDATSQHAWFIPDVAGDYQVSSGAVPAWTAGGTYNLNDYVSANGALYKCTQAGTAGSTAPSGYGTITDGGVKWSYQTTYLPLVVHADTFSGVSTCGACHGPGGMAAAPKPQYAAWTTSAHAVDPDVINGNSLFQNELLGLEHGAQSCLVCHTTGNDPGQSGNKGFSDNATADGWTYPATTVAWSTVPTNLQQFNGIQCESCHGPVGLINGGDHQPAVSFNASVCGRCHDDNVGSYHDRYSLWSLSPTGHSLRSLALRGAVDRSPVNLTADTTTGYANYGAASCARCHTAQGFAAYVKQQFTGGATDDTDPCYGSETGDYLANAACYLNDPSLAVTQQTTNGLNSYLTGTVGLTASNVEPQTCQACHDPHTAALRLEDDTHVLPAGFRVQPTAGWAGPGAGALCMLCHNSRNGAHGDAVAQISTAKYTINGSPVALPTIGAPHDSTAADVFSGNNLYFTDSYVQKTGKHLLYVDDTCVGCHVAINVGGLSKESKAPNHLFKVDSTICAGCHSNATTLTDPAAGIEAQFDEYLGTLSTTIGNAYMAAVTRLDTGSQGYVNIVGGSGKQTARFQLSDIQSVGGPSTDPRQYPKYMQVLITFNPGANVLDPTKDAGSGTTMTSYWASLTSLVWETTDQHGTANAGRPIIDPSGLLQRAVYNHGIFLHDGSSGVHNWSFVQNGFVNTKKVLDAYISTGALPSGVTAP